MMIKNIGFTLIELIVTLAVAAILITVAGPNFLTFIQNNRLTTQANDMVGSLQLARSEAVKRNASTTAPVRICGSNNPTAALPSCHTGTSWKSGWVVFLDNGTTANDVDSNDTILQQHEGLSGGNTLNRSSSPPNLISFIGTGFPLSTVTLALCDNRNESWGKEIIISTTGHISTISAPKDLAAIAACSP